MKQNPQYKECYIQVQAYKGVVKTLEQQNAWYQQNQLAYEEKIRVLERDLSNTKNELKYFEKEKEKVVLEKQELQDKFEIEVAGRMKQQHYKNPDDYPQKFHTIFNSWALTHILPINYTRFDWSILPINFHGFTHEITHKILYRV